LPLLIPALASLKREIKQWRKWAVLSWIGGAAVVAGGSIWIAVTYYVDHNAAHDQAPNKEQIEQQSAAQDALINQLAEQEVLIKRLAAEQEALIKRLQEKNPSTAPGAEQAVGAAVSQVANLTKMLAPGAEQAVGAAVQSIAQGAEAGDSGLKKALDLLKENKLTEATQLLAAFADEREARAEGASAQAEKDRKEAAVAYRNLGAIAGLGDPKGASRLMKKRSRSIRMMSRACFGRAGFRLSMGISKRHKRGLSACKSSRRPAISRSTNT
jgi:hypothetical protein